MKQQGGEILGQGLYGCAFKPPLKCKNNKKTKGVGKILSNEDAYQEFSISKILKTIPHAEEYFVIVDSICEPLPRSKQNEKSLSECLPLKGVNLTTVSQITMPFGGKPLGLLKQNLSYDNLYMISQKLLEGVSLLTTARIVHYDLHKNNILITPDGNVQIIDFGKAWSPDIISVSNYYNLIVEYLPENVIQPPEHTLVSAIESKVDLNMALANIHDKKGILTLIYKLTGKTVENQIIELKNFTNKSIAFRKRDWYNFYKLYSDKYDSWSIGVILITLFINILMLNGKTDPRNPVLLECIRGLTCMDPGMRLTSIEALEILFPDSKILQVDLVKNVLNDEKNTRQELLTKIRQD
jgi:serine/threonine protein kinase